MLRLLTAGESHGPALVGVIEGLPAGLRVTAADVDRELARRQGGYGRSGRQRLEQDRVRILAGVRHGRTLGSPLALLVENRDHANWLVDMAVAELAPGQEPQRPPVTQPRPGHADLAGGMKYGHRDLRNVLERSSARETAMRTAAGAVARLLLAEMGIRVGSYVTRIGDVHRQPGAAEDALALAAAAEASPVRCPWPDLAAAMVAAIDAAGHAGDTLGGVFEVVAVGCPPGLGSHVQPDRRLDARLAAAVMSINGVKGVEIGLGFTAAALPGSQVHDPILPADRPGGGRYRRPTNNAGGLEGGMTNGSPVVVRAAMKPLSTLRRPLATVDIESHQPTVGHHERSDVAAVPAAAVIGEAVVAWELAVAALEKFGGDSLADLLAAVAAYRARLEAY